MVVRWGGGGRVGVGGWVGVWVVVGWGGMGRGGRVGVVGWMVVKGWWVV